MTSYSKAGIAAIIVMLFATVALIQHHQSMHPLEDAPGADISPVLPGVSADLPRLVILKTEACIQCQRMIPVLAELERQFADRFTAHTFDVGRDQRAGTAFGLIRILPTLIFMDQAGQELYRLEGYMSKAEVLERWRHLGLTI